VNRKPDAPSSFPGLPMAGEHGATYKRWPVTTNDAVVPFAPRSTFGYKGIPSSLGFTSTVKMPSECFYSSTR
jgi:hypothetical protein